MLELQLRPQLAPSPLVAAPTGSLDLCWLASFVAVGRLHGPNHPLGPGVNLSLRGRQGELSLYLVPSLSIFWQPREST